MGEERHPDPSHQTPPTRPITSYSHQTPPSSLAHVVDVVLNTVAGVVPGSVLWEQQQLACVRWLQVQLTFTITLGCTAGTLLLLP